MRSALAFLARQAILSGSAALAYFGVRGLTEGGAAAAWRNADDVLRLERHLGLDVELGLQDIIGDRQFCVDLANWIYIWGHWPVVIATLVWLALKHRGAFYELRNAMFISGAIGLLIFAMFAVTPPRLFGPEYVDTVTNHSEAYRILQPPQLVNKYAAVPSLHFGWNLLVAIAWYRVRPVRWMAAAAVLMPLAMGFAVVATANHWVLDVVAGGATALAGLSLERWRRRRFDPVALGGDGARDGGGTIDLTRGPQGGLADDSDECLDVRSPDTENHSAAIMTNQG